ncbi:2-oxo-hepta-3-ene-1,7-dioic acid hydratase, partial [Salmonella enterica subsp. enterica serovar Typhi]|nr:2-oxo-hepta-3-ene-1,7-dioic acid hydratase [Salmonella enterica subsp. enterica serovar Typhi]
EGRNAQRTTKSASTSKAMQASSQISEPDYGALQREWVNIKIAEGRNAQRTTKSASTSKAMQASSQISEPDYGAL